MTSEAQLDRSESGLEFDPHFEEQYHTRNVVERHGGRTRYVDILPKETHEHSRTILLAPGFISGIEQQSLPIRRFYEAGHRVISVNHARSGKPVSSEPGFHDHITQKADNLAGALEHAGAENVTVVAHSEGFVSSVLMALRWSRNCYPKDMPHGIDIEKIIGVAPFGLVESNMEHITGFGPMILDGARQMRDHPQSGEIGKAVFKYLLNHPARTPQEARALRKVHAFDHAAAVASEIPVHIMLHHNDEVISSKRHYKLFKKKAEEDELPFEQIWWMVDREPKHAGLLNDEGTIRAAIDLAEKADSNRLIDIGLKSAEVSTNGLMQAVEEQRHTAISESP